MDCCNRHVVLIDDFSHWVLNESPEWIIALDSMEQEWLGFAMKEIYKKEWNGKKWIATGQPAASKTNTVIKKSAKQDAVKYTYHVTWSAEDEEYVGLCAEFPNLSWLAKSQEDALTGIKDVVRELIQDMQTKDEAVPQPFALR